MASVFLLVPSWVLWVLGFGFLILFQNVWMLWYISLFMYFPLLMIFDCSISSLCPLFFILFFFTLMSLLLMFFLVGGFCLFIHQVFHLYHFSFKFLISLPCFSHIADVLIHIAFFYFYFILRFIYFMCFFSCMYICGPCSCLVLTEVRRGCPGPWKKSCRCLWVTMWKMGINLGLLNCWAVSTAPSCLFLVFFLLPLTFLFKVALNWASCSYPVWSYWFIFKDLQICWCKLIYQFYLEIFLLSSLVKCAQPLAPLITGTKMVLFVCLFVNEASTSSPSILESSGLTQLSS